MKYSILILILSGFIINSTGIVFARCSELSPVEQKGFKTAKIQLFNGKNLDGWYTFLKKEGRNNDPNKVFTVKNGLIRR